MHCGGCGCEEYHIKFEIGGDAWVECSECGRPTGVFGVGEQKKRAWERENAEEEARYRNPPTYYGVEGVPGMEGDDDE